MTAPHVTDLGSARPAREPATVILQVANVRADSEVHRQVGVNAALTLEELQEVLAICFDFPTEGTPWHFYGHRQVRLDPGLSVGEALPYPGSRIDFTWGLWDFSLQVAAVYPRDADTPRALCVGGSGAFSGPFDITGINARLTGRKAIAAVLEQVVPPVRDVVLRSKLLDFVPLLQAMDLSREPDLAPPVRAALDGLPREVTEEGRDAFWSMVLALACLGTDDLTDSVLETTMDALGWVDAAGQPRSAADIRLSCAASLDVLAELGACGPHQMAPVDRLDLYRALLRRRPGAAGRPRMASAQAPGK